MATKYLQTNCGDVSQVADNRGFVSKGPSASSKLSQSPWRCSKLQSRWESSKVNASTARLRIFRRPTMYVNNLTIGIDKIINLLCLGCFFIWTLRAMLRMMDLWRVTADNHLPDNVGPNYSRLGNRSVLHVIAACLTTLTVDSRPLSMAKAINISPSREINLRFESWRWKFHVESWDAIHHKAIGYCFCNMINLFSHTSRVHWMPKIIDFHFFFFSNTSFLLSLKKYFDVFDYLFTWK